MFGFLANIPSILGKGLGYAGQGLKAAGSGLGKLPQRLGMADDPSGMLRTPDFVSTGGRAMPDFKPPIQSGGLTDLLYRGPSGGNVNLAPRPSADWNPMREASAAPTALPMRNIGAREALTNIARAENPPLEQAPQYRDPIREARDEFVNDRLQNRARWKQMLIPALLGFASQAESGNVGRMAGGALGGFGMGAFAPEQALQGEYEMREGGRDREELQREEDWRKAQAALGNMKEQRENERRRIEQQGQIEAQRQRYQTERDRLKDEQWNKEYELKKNPPVPKLHNVPEGGTAIDPTGKVIFQSPRVPKPLSYGDETKDVEAQLDAEEGTVESIARDSTEARRQEVFQKLPAPVRTILEGGMVKESQLKEVKDAQGRPTGNYEPVDFERPATPAEVESARRAYDAEMDRLLKQNEAYTRSVRRKGVQSRRGGGSRPASGGGSMGAAAGGRRNVNDLLKLLK